MRAPDQDLLKSLTGHPTALDHTLGCMTGIFHIFEGHPAFMGRRSSSTRLGVDSGHSQLRTQTDSHSNRHDRRNPTSTMEDRHKETVQPTSQHRKSYSDISDMAATPTRTFTEFRTSRDENGDMEPKPAYSEGTKPCYSEGTKPAFSEGTVDALAFYNYESLRAAAIFAGDPRRRSDLDHRSYSKRSLSSPKRSIPKARQANSDAQQSSSSDIRDALLATFRGESERPNANSDPALKRNGRKEAGSRKAANLPRSNSVFARGLEPNELLHWKDGLRSSASPPRRLTREAAPLKGNKSPSRPSSGATKMLSHHSSPERRVEPKKDRGRPLSRDYPYVSRSPKKIFGPHGETTLGKDYNDFKESPGASDFRESLRPFMSTGAARDRHIVPARESFASRLADSSGVMSSGQDLDGRGTSVNVIARLMGLEAEIPSNSTQQCIHSSSKAAPDHAKSRGDKFFRGLVQFDPQTMRSSSPPPPPPCQSKKHHLGPPSGYYNKQQYYGPQGDQYQDNYPPQFNMEQGLCCCEEDRDYEHLHISRPYLSFEDDCKEATGYYKEGSPPLADANHSAPEVCSLLMKQSPHKKKMLWKILEAMRPKGLLKISRRKQTEQQEKSPITKSVTKDIVQPVQQVLEKQQQTAQMKSASYGSKLSSGVNNVKEPPRYSSSIRQVQLQEQEQQTDSSNSTESSIVKPCISQPDETTIVVMKPTANTLSSSRSQLPNADIFQVRQVETASSNSYEKEKFPTRRTAQRNNEDCSLANDQRRATEPVKSRVAVETAPRSSAHAESTLQSDCETDPSSVTTQHVKPDNVRESRKIRITTRPNPRSRSPIPDTHRKQGLGSSPEVARPSLTRSLPSNDLFHGTSNTVGRKSVVANGKKDSRPTPANAKAKLPKEVILKRRVSESPVTSRLRGSSLENESTLSTQRSTGKGTFPIRAAGAKARSPGAARLKQSNAGAESVGAPLRAPPKELDVTCPSTTHPVTLDTSDNLNSADQIQPAAAQPQPSDSEPAMEHLVAVQGPKLGEFQKPHVYIRSQLSEVQSEVQSEDVQMIEGVSAGDQCEDAEQPSNSGACTAIPDEPQPLLEIQEAAIEASEEMTTPRGNQLKDEKLDDTLAEAMDRTSPVSVLDNTTFDDELTLSPTSSSKHNVVPMQEDFVATDNDEEHQGCAKDVEAYPETSSAENDLDFDELFSKCVEGLQAQVESPETENHVNMLQSYFKDAEPGEEKTSFLSAPEIDSCSGMNSCVSDKLKTKQKSRFELPDTEKINENLLQSLQSNGILQENDHILLLDCLEEIMERILDSQSNLMLWAGLPSETICETPKGKQLEQELWLEVQNMKRSSGSGDICDAVHRLLLKNLLRCQGRQWSTFNADREKIGLDMETMIVGDLIEEAVGDLCALQCHRKGSDLPTETTRRQLFTN